jgi:chromate transporter
MLVGAIAAAVVLLSPTPLAQIGVIVGGGIAGWAWLPDGRPGTGPASPVATRRRAGGVALLLFFVLLVVLPLLAAAYPLRALALIDSFYRSGSLVFGGGHVVLPLLQSEVVPSGWVREDLFLAGYGAAQAVPGPLFTFAAYLGAVMEQPPNGWSAALLCLGAIFLPSFLLVYGALPFWDALRRQQHMQAALSGVNAAVTGLLLAALAGTVGAEAIRSSTDLGLVLVALVLLVVFKLPAWLVVLAAAAGGIGLQLAIRN